MDFSSSPPAKKQRTKKRKNKIDKYVEKIPDTFQDVTKEVVNHVKTISIALPGSILDNAQSRTLKAFLPGQIARAAALFEVNEIVIYNDSAIPFQDSNAHNFGSHHCHSVASMGIFLQYLECPNFIRKILFPKHPDLRMAQELNRVELQHLKEVTEESRFWQKGQKHNIQTDLKSDLLANIIGVTCCSYPCINRFSEGIISKRLGPTGKSYAKISEHSKDVLVDKKLDPGTRVTIKLEPIQPQDKFRKGQIVSPLTPLATTGEYWGYQVRLADSLATAMSQSSFKEGYDLIIGTSERGKSVYDVTFPDFKHALVVFGGVRGLEEAVENDDTITTSDPSDLFKFYINICPNQGSRTIRTEEAVFIALSVLRDVFVG